MPTLAIRDVVFVGLGQMGRAMVRHLHNDPRFRVVGVDISAGSRGASEAFGLVVYDAAEKLPGWGDCVLACLPSPEDVLQLAERFGKLPARARPRFFLDLSTIGPIAAARVEKALDEQCPEMLFVECPITGGVLRAARRECSLLCGCRDRSLLEPIMPLLSVMASSVIYVGSATSASTAKLVNNVAAMNIAVATLEAMTLGVRSGLALSTLFEVLAHGTATSYILLSALQRALIDGDFETGFALRLAAKDMRLALQQGTDAGCELPHTKLTLQLFDDGIAAGLEDYTFPIISAMRGILPIGRTDQVPGPHVVRGSDND